MAPAWDTAGLDHPTASRQSLIDKVMAENDCSTTGFAADVILSSALVLPDDRVNIVSFDDGWASYIVDQTGTVLAVCAAALQREADDLGP